MMQTLSQQLASEPAANATVHIMLSFRDKHGHYCRTFTLRTQAGLACRQNGEWQVPVLAQTASRVGNDARQAGSALPEPLLRAIEDRIADVPLDAAGEKMARQSRWGDP